MNPASHPTISPQAAPGEALSIKRFFTTPGVHPFDTVAWEARDARIGHGLFQNSHSMPVHNAHPVH